MMKAKPVIIQSLDEMRSARRKLKGSVGFVPTMGYLHRGHLSLVQESQKVADDTIVSIYVNPTQFGPNEDLNNYPRDFDHDISLLRDLNVKHVFFPTDEMMYPADFKSWVTVDKLTENLCGRSRQNHFRGVTTIVSKLLNIINPDLMFLGEKDFQQLKVLQQMEKDLNFFCRIIGCPIVREEDGLALSSRNKYLSADERKRAACLRRSLLLARDLYSSGVVETDEITAAMSELIKLSNGRIDYIEIVDPETLEPVEIAQPDSRVILAVYIGKTRLIDNLKIQV